MHIRVYFVFCSSPTYLAAAMMHTEGKSSKHKTERFFLKMFSLSHLQHTFKLSYRLIVLGEVES